MADNSPLVSIIIPAFNTAQYIHRAIGSSIRQTHKNVEILIVDDGSTDDTLRVANYFAGTDKRIRVFTQKNGGVSVARNHAMREAKGEYFTFLDSDDWLEDDAVEIMLNAQNENPSCMVCANQFWNVQVTDGKLSRYFGTWNNTPSGVYDMKEIAETFCFLRIPNVFRSPCVKLFRSSTGAKFPEGLKYAEDAVFVTDYLMRTGGKAFYISRPLLNVLAREGSAVRRKYNSEIFDSLNASGKIIIDLMKDDETRKLMSMSRVYYAYFCFMSAVAEEAGDDEINRIKSAMNPAAWDVIECDKYPFETRLQFFLAAFAPVSVYKEASSLLESRKTKNDDDSKPEIIQGWQDFPKAPGI